MKLQHYLLKKSDHPAVIWAVGVLTFFESIFLFVPPEVFMTPPIIANKKNAVPAVAAAAIGSLLGGAASYVIGMLLYDSVGMWIIGAFSSPEKFAAAQALFDKYGILIIFITAFTPVPYKLMSMCAGFIGFNPAVFLGVSAVFRTGRFAIIGFLLWRFQEQANAIVRKYFWPLTIFAILAAALGVLLMRYL